MKSKSMLARLNRKLLLSLALGGTLLQVSFSGCDQTLRDTVLTGVQASLTGLVTTFINAFFQALMTDNQTSQPIVQAVLESLPKLA